MEEFPSWPKGTDCKSVSLAFSGSNPLSSTILNLIKKLFMRMWLSGRASPCQGEGREFESRHPLHFFYVSLAQLDRASGYGPEGRGFESSRIRQKKLVILYYKLFCFMQECWNRQTGMFEGHVREIAWGFKSLFLHQKIYLTFVR